MLAPTENQQAFINVMQQGIEPHRPNEVDLMEQRAGLLDKAGSFIGMSVRAVRQLEEPITAFYFSSPYPGFGTRGYRPQHGLLVREHPSRATGIIESIDLEQSVVRVKPRRLSLYRADKGFFLVRILNEDHEQLVHLTLGD